MQGSKIFLESVNLLMKDDESKYEIERLNLQLGFFSKHFLFLKISDEMKIFCKKY